ncbi:MAG: LysE family translocator [Pseudomonadota bacterium]
MPIDVIVAFTVAALAMNLSPGPSNLYVMARSISQGAGAGVLAAIGLAVGSMVHAAATVFGLSAIFASSPTLYLLVKIIGAAYLIYLGVSYWRSSLQPIPDDPGAVDDIRVQKSMRQIFYESLIVELTNPKTALFFIALLPQFVDPAYGAVTPQLLLLGTIVVVSALPCDLLVAVAASKVSSWLGDHPNAGRVQDRVSGSILLGLGAYVAVDSVQS